VSFHRGPILPPLHRHADLKVLHRDDDQGLLDVAIENHLLDVGFIRARQFLEQKPFTRVHGQTNLQKHISTPERTEELDQINANRPKKHSPLQRPDSIDSGGCGGDGICGGSCKWSGSQDSGRAWSVAAEFEIELVMVTAASGKEEKKERARKFQHANSWMGDIGRPRFGTENR
jgi:hypothetical protein